MNGGWRRAERLKLRDLFSKRCRDCRLLTGTVCCHENARNRVLRRAHAETTRLSDRIDLFLLLDSRYRQVYDYDCLDCANVSYDERSCDHSDSFARVLVYIRRRLALYLFKSLDEMDRLEMAEAGFGPNLETLHPADSDDDDQADPWEGEGDPDSRGDRLIERARAEENEIGPQR